MGAVAVWVLAAALGVIIELDHLFEARPEEQVEALIGGPINPACRLKSLRPVGLLRTVSAITCAFTVSLFGGACDGAVETQSTSSAEFVSPLDEYLSLVLGLANTPDESYRIQELRNINRETHYCSITTVSASWSAASVLKDDNGALSLFSMSERFTR